MNTYQYDFPAYLARKVDTIRSSKLWEIRFKDLGKFNYEPNPEFNGTVTLGKFNLLPTGAWVCEVQFLSPAEKYPQDQMKNAFDLAISEVIRISQKTAENFPTNHPSIYVNVL